ncbi:hypothetical protein H4R99_005824 [Coemansia sp. RSA 1722]|nr:hypothetical protein H4R99_005824 [Coemansia sp. RSA 1722]
MEQSLVGLSSLCPATTPESSVQSSPCKSAGDISAHQKPQQPKQQKNHARARGTKPASGLSAASGHARSASSCEYHSSASASSSVVASADSIHTAVESSASTGRKQPAGAHPHGAATRNKAAKSDGASNKKSDSKKTNGGNNCSKSKTPAPGKQRRQNSARDLNQQQAQTQAHQPPLSLSSSFLLSNQPLGSGKGQSQSQNHHSRKQQNQNQHQQPPHPSRSSSRKSNQAWSLSAQSTPTSGVMSPQYTHSGSRSQSKHKGTKGEEDEEANFSYNGSYGESDDELEAAISVSQEEWDLEVRDRVVLPLGLEKTLTAQILHTYETRLFPSAESIEIKRAFIEKFATILLYEFPNQQVEIHVFGSSVNGLGTSRSDVDICLTTEYKELENVFVLNKVLRKYNMRTYCVPHARVPIIKSWDPELRIASDINVNNTIALHNTRMIQTFVAIDARVRPFVMAIKHWTKCREINDAAFGGTLSPYAWVNLAINFLQMRSPPILPVLHPQSHAEDAESNSYGAEQVDLRFNDDIEQLRGFGLANTESLGFLLYAFFRTYAYEFDYRHQVVSLRQGCHLTKVQKGWDSGRPSRIFCIEEPFSTWLNLGHSANTTSVEGIRQEFQRGFHILRDGGSFDEVCEVYQRPQRITSGQISSSSCVTSATITGGEPAAGIGHYSAFNGTATTATNSHGGGIVAAGSHKQPRYPQRSSSYSPGYGMSPYGVYYSTPGATPHSMHMQVQRRESFDNLMMGGTVRNKNRKYQGRMQHNPRYWHSTPSQIYTQQHHEEIMESALNTPKSSRSSASSRTGSTKDACLELSEHLANLTVS